ncbi:hypothetical protein LCGC14_2283690 [marine sediment metagenome]|uniref:Uncharacterized protein n=1 Tax=marine sediment metagenome TaxID=412755 RepID=A0A0F9F5T4_9ZZZZ
MTIQDQIRQQAADLKFDITTQQINRVAGTLRYCRIRIASNLDPLIRKELQRLMQQAQKELPTVEADVLASANTARDGTFKKIDDSLRQGNCPRCGKKMRNVNLADYTPALYCEGECRITLWPQEK